MYVYNATSDENYNGILITCCTYIHSDRLHASTGGDALYIGYRLQLEGMHCI